MPDSKFYRILVPSVDIRELADRIECKLSNSEQDLALEINAVNSLEQASKGELSFLSNKKYIELLETTNASACIVPKDFTSSYNKKIVLLYSDNPYYSYTKAIKFFYQSAKKYQSKIEPTAYISSSAVIGKNCYIGHNVVINDHVKIGNDSVIEANSVIDSNVIIGDRANIGSNVSISFTIIGNDVVILPGARIGTDGFGFSTHQGKHYKVFHIGRVIIGNDVEIGSNTTIDRGSVNDTIIEDGVRVDNLVQIAHNVKIGKGSILAGMVGIAGSTEIGQYSLLGGQAGLAGHLKIGNQVQIAASSGVMNDIPDRQIWGGMPAVPIKQWHRQTILQKKMIEQFQKNINNT